MKVNTADRCRWLHAGFIRRRYQVRLLGPLLFWFAGCTASAQIAQLCDAEGQRCALVDGLPRIGVYRSITGTIEIDRARCDANWPLCEWAVYHEIGHATGKLSEHEANCFALAHSSMPARRAAEQLLGAGWERECK